MKNAFKCLFVFLMVIVICSSANAGSISDLKKEKQELQSEVNATGNLLAETRNEKNSALAEINELDRELTNVTEDLIFINEQLEITEALIQDTETELAEAEEKRESQYNAYKKRVRYIYINGSVGYLDVILKAENVVDLLNRVEYVNRIVENDRALVDKLTETENLIEEKLSDISKSKREWEFLSAQQDLKRNSLEDAKQKKAVLVKRLSADEDMYLQQLNDLEEDNKRLEKLIKDAEAEQARRIAEENAKAVSAYTGGKIGWPVPSSGRITSYYGNRIHPINGKQELHTGIDIAAAYGADIVAAEAGVVISAGWNGGYGNAVVISHGNGLSTLYAHNSKLTVSVGDSVKKGQTIAKAGSTGYSTGNHLHFEVRINGGHTNPINYVK